MEEQINIESRNNYGVWAIAFILLSTILQAYFGYARDASEWAKALISLCSWGAVGFCLMKIENIKYFPKISQIIIFGLGCLIIWSIIHILLFGKVYDGNKYIVTFGNMYGALNLIGPAFMFGVISIREMKALRNAVYAMVYISIILLLLQFTKSIESYFLTYVCAFSPIFLFYSKKYDQALLCLSILFTLFCFYGGGRQSAFFFLFAIAALAGAKVLNKRWIFYISVIITLLPFIFMYVSSKYGSIFDIALSSMNADSNINTNSGEAINADNRTFLWLEFLYDFAERSTTTKLLGQGAVAYYDSAFFRTFNRMGIEVPILQWIMQAGLLYIILFTIFVIHSIYRLYKYGDNDICKIASILIAAYYFDSYICNTNGCSIMQFGVWFLLSIAYHQELLSADNETLKKIFSQNENYEFAYFEEDDEYMEDDDDEHLHSECNPIEESSDTRER